MVSLSRIVPVIVDPTITSSTLDGQTPQECARYSRSHYNQDELVIPRILPVIVDRTIKSSTLDKETPQECVRYSRSHYNQDILVPVIVDPTITRTNLYPPEFCPL